MSPKSILCRGIRYKIVWESPGEDLLGTCDDRSGKSPEIWIDPNQSDSQIVDTLIHEILHACLPDLSEDAVTETATVIARAIRRLPV